MTKNRAAIIALVKAMEGRDNNQPPQSAIFSDYFRSGCVGEVTV